MVNTIEVEDLDASIETAIAAGGSVALEKQIVPSVGSTAYMLSPTGILFAMIERVPGGVT